MVDFQSQIAAALKDRKANENTKTTNVRGSFWFYHVYFELCYPNRVIIHPRSIAIRHMNDPGETRNIHSGQFGTIAVDQKGRFGFVVCSENDNFERKEGRRRALGKLLGAQNNKSGIWNFGPSNFYKYTDRLVNDVLPDAVGEALARFLTDGFKKRS